MTWIIAATASTAVVRGDEMKVGREVEDGFEILNDIDDIIGIARRDRRTGRANVTPGSTYGGLDLSPTLNQQLHDFAGAEFRRRWLAGKQGHARETSAALRMI